jgi:hypothetical protein
MKNSEFVTKWVIDTVKRDYVEDIALIVSHTTLRLDDQEKTVSYFVPITERGCQFGRTFILNGEGFDIWGINWERLEKFADLDEYNITCLADGEILYARTAEDARRFENLKKRQEKNLSDRATMRKCALTAYAQAKNIFLEMLFAENSDAKMSAGYVLDYLAQAIAFSNLRYFKKAQTAQIEELSSMQSIPEDFLRIYRRIIEEPDVEIQKKLCYEAIRMIQQFLEAQPPLNEEGEKNKADFQMLADWYAELSYTWLRIRYYAKMNDAVKVYMWGIMLQQELNSVCAEFGLEKMRLMEHYHVGKLAEFADYSNQLEYAMRTIITEGGGLIHTYSDFEEFLHEV